MQNELTGTPLTFWFSEYSEGLGEQGPSKSKRHNILTPKFWQIERAGSGPMVQLSVLFMGVLLPPGVL